jgi:hypothetical protein
MRFSRLHPAFVLFLVLGLLGAALAIWFGLLGATRCDQSGDLQVTASCNFTAQNFHNLSQTLAVASLAVIVGGVGFQIGRGAPPATSTSTFIGQRSADGAWQWDGTTWVPTGPQTGPPPGAAPPPNH